MTGAGTVRELAPSAAAAPGSIDIGAVTSSWAEQLCQDAPPGYKKLAAVLYMARVCSSTSAWQPLDFQFDLTVF